MKNTVKHIHRIAGVIAVAAIIVISMAGCLGMMDDGTQAQPQLRAGLYNKNSPTGSDTPLSITSQLGANVIEKAMNYIGTSTGIYTLVLDEDITAANSINFNKNGVILTIDSINTTERVISKMGGITDGNALFVVSNGATLTIIGHVTLEGKKSDASNSYQNNQDAVVRVLGGTLNLRGNAKITGNMHDSASSSRYGGGVYAKGDGAGSQATIMMTGNAEISNNSVYDGGGGVYLEEWANLTMNPNGTGTPKIFGNRVQGSSGAADTYGGGVYVGEDCIFTMNSGEIYGNRVENYDDNALGGGVYIADFASAQFIVATNEARDNIKNNIAETTGTGTAIGNQVYKDTDGVFRVNSVDQGTPGTAEGFDNW